MLENGIVAETFLCVEFPSFLIKFKWDGSRLQQPESKCKIRGTVSFPDLSESVENDTASSFSLLPTGCWLPCLRFSQMSKVCAVPTVTIDSTLMFIMEGSYDFICLLTNIFFFSKGEVAYLQEKDSNKLFGGKNILSWLGLFHSVYEFKL